MKRIIAILLLLTATLPAQYYFGKNKIQYADYDWKRLRTEHFDIYFFAEEEQLARITAYEVERYWEDHVGNFRFVPQTRVPVIIYPASNLFQETNTIPWILPEGVGGFTEYFKGRVVLPYNGRYRDFQHTLKHELVHAFIMHKNTFVHDAHELFFLSFLPLWFEEGLAEHFSERTSPEMEMVVRSSLLEGDFVPLSRIYEISGSFRMYKLAQSFMDWLAREYGEGRVALVIEDIHDFRYFDELFEAHFGISLDEAGRKWENHLKEKYWPMITEGDLPAEAGKLLTTAKDGINLSPVAYQFEGDSTRSIIFQSTRMGYAAIYRMNKGKTSLILKAGMTEEMEEMHLFRNSFSVSSAGVMAISVKVQGGDMLTLVDARTGEILRQRRCPDVPGIGSPQIDGESRRVVFSGIGLNGFSDLHIYDIEADSFARLTDDIYGDFDPTFDGDYIIFTSDRVEGNGARIGLCRISLDSGEIEHLSGAKGSFAQPYVRDDRRILVSLELDNFLNIWEYLPEENQIVKRSNILTALNEPSAFGEDSIVATVYTKSSYQILILDGDTVYDSIAVEWRQWEQSWKPRQLSSDIAAGKIGYDTKLSFDVAQGAISTNTSMESGGGIEGLFSDMIGDKQIYFMVYNQFDDWKNILRNLNVAAVYYNMEDRPIWGAGGYHFYAEGFNPYDFGFSEETAGFMGTVGYPFNRFTRAEATGYLFYSEKSYFADIEPVRYGGFSSLKLSLIRDNAIWGHTGPIEGFRGNATIGGTVRLNTGEVSSYLASADLRYYLRLTKRSALAFRMVGRTSDGPEPERFWMGGTWDFRGYPFYYFYGRNLVFSSTELRYPLLDQFRLKFPFLDADMRGIRGAVFFDVGQTWETERKPLVGSVGKGLRMNLGNVTCLRFDMSWRTDFHSGFDRPYYDIFFGWDF